MNLSAHEPITNALTGQLDRLQTVLRRIFSVHTHLGPKQFISYFVSVFKVGRYLRRNPGALRAGSCPDRLETPSGLPLPGSLRFITVVWI